MLVLITTLIMSTGDDFEVALVVYLPTIKSMAGGVNVRTPDNIDFYSLVHMGRIGLFNAVRRNKQDDRKYVAVCIRNAMNDLLRSEIMVTGGHERDCDYDVFLTESPRIKYHHDLVAAINKLDDIQQSVISLLYWEGLSDIDVEKRMGLGANRAERIHKKALRNLRYYMRD